MELAIVIRTYSAMGFGCDFIVSVRLSSRANEDRRIIYPPTLHVLNTEVLGGTGFVRRMIIVWVFVRLAAARSCAIQSVVSCFNQAAIRFCCLIS